MIAAAELVCVHSPRCGGCAFMGVAADVQLEEKQRSVQTALNAYPELRALSVESVVGAEPMLEYRTRAKLVVSPQGEIGLFARGSHDVVDIPGCRVLHPLLLQVVAEIRARLRLQSLPLAGLDLRLVSGEKQPGVLLTLAGGHEARAQLLAFARDLSSSAGVLGVAVRLQTRGVVQQLEGVPEPVWGIRVARDALRPGGLYTYAAHGSFVQAHRGQAAAIADRIMARLIASSGELRGKRVLELYAGSGALGLELCARGAQVTLVERYAPALEHALRAQSEQQLRGLTVECGDAEQVLGRLLSAQAAFDAVIVNPPRRGLTPLVRARIAELTPRALVYVSCEPTTLARDLADLGQRGLAAHGVTPFDMMPLSADVESLVVLQPAACTPIEVLYQDHAMLVVDKPPYLPTIPEAEHALSLLTRLAHEHDLPDLAAVHRLDVGTSGVCLFAKSRAHVPALVARLAQAQKHYLALVRGHVHAKGIVRAALREQGKTRQAISRYTRAERIAGHALLRVRPEHGRTHQVRKHMAAIDHPVLGDARYGDEASNRFFEHKHGLQRPFLHAWRIQLPADAGQQPIVFEAPLAADLAVVLASLRASSTGA
jgi:23S rRNA (uracil1939-C5)-methyltransferase